MEKAGRGLSFGYLRVLLSVVCLLVLFVKSSLLRETRIDTEGGFRDFYEPYIKLVLQCVHIKSRNKYSLKTLPFAVEAPSQENGLGTTCILKLPKGKKLMDERFRMHFTVKGEKWEMRRLCEMKCFRDRTTTGWGEREGLK